MKRLAQILCAIVGIGTFSSYAMAYAAGLRGSWLFIDIVPALLSLLCTAALIVLVVVACIRRREWQTTLLMGALAVLLFALGRVVVPAAVFQAGFRSKITSAVTTDELRQIAFAVRGTLTEGGSLPGPQKNLWNEKEDRGPWDSLVKTTALGKLDPWMIVFKHKNSVELSWGGALVGHWGVIIDTGIEQREGDIAKGIRTYTTSE